MAHLYGTEGKVQTGGANDLDVEEWTITPTTEITETTDSGDANNRTWLAGLLGATGTVRAKWDTANDWFIVPNVKVGQTVTLKLYIGNSTKFFSCSAIVTSTPFANPIRDAVTIGFDFTVTGALTYPTA
jgi:hypothetical protein